jgi:hypothetical protein
MLQNAVEQVDAMASKQQYRDAAMKARTAHTGRVQPGSCLRIYDIEYFFLRLWV